ncbi:MAG: histidine kinase [Prolixibacteraceae bacterium]
MIIFPSLSDRRLKITLHAIAWLVIILIPLYLNTAFGGNQHRLNQFYTHTFSAILIFYVGYLWLVPKFFLREKYWIYFIILSGVITASYYMTAFINDQLLYDVVEDARFQEFVKKLAATGVDFKPPMKAFGFYNHIIASLLISGFAVGLGLNEKLKLNEKKQKEMEKEKLHSELAFLKNQVSPHFFFNTLNNIYSQIGIDGPTAQQSVLKLSKMMRYLLYESERGETLMSHEIEFMDNYVDLMKLRLSPRVDLQIEFPKDYADFSIAPLLFIPFIENAFKHGVGQRGPSFIKIRMEIANDRILFITENSICKSGQTGDLEHSGIGLENVKKRLSLLFAGRHELNITHGESVFEVKLSIVKEKMLS